MALRGETIGTAYVRILADGKGFDKSLQKELRKSDPDREDVFEDAGNKDGKAYNKGVSDELGKLDSAIAHNIRFAESRGRFGALGHENAQQFMDNFEADLRRDFGDKVGGRLAIEMRESVFRRGSLSAIKDFNENIGRNIHTVTEQILKDEEKARQASEDFETQWRRNMNQIDKDTDRILAGVSREVDSWNTSFRKAGDNINRFGLNASRDIEKFNLSLQRNSRQIRKTGKDNDRLLGRMSHEIFKFSDVAGTAFGRGSRNNFLNFFGSVVRNVSRIPGYFIAAAGAVTKFASGLGKVAEEGEKGSGIMNTFFKVIGGGIAGMVAFAIAVTVVIGVIGPLASLLSGLIGILVALASSLAFAAVAGFGVLLGSVLPVVAAVGLLVVAVIGLDKQMKKSLGTAFKPVTDAFKDLAEIAGKNIFGPLMKAAPVIAEVLRGMAPLVDKVTESLGGWPAMFTKIVQSPAFIKFQRQMGIFIPDMVDDLGRIFANVFKGMLGLFRAVLPITGDFFDWLRKITGEFRDFTNSTKGQHALKEFFNDAADSAEAVLGFLDSILDAIGELFSAGRESGDTIFSDMEGAVRRFITFLKENPDAVKQWFGDAVKTARSIGHAIESIIELFDKLDTPENRKKIQKFFNAVEAVALALGIMFGYLERKVEQLHDGFVNIGHAIGAVKGFFDRLRGTIEDMRSHVIVGLVNAIQGVRNVFNNAGGAVGQFAANMQRDVGGAVDRVVDFIHSIPRRIRGLAGDMRDAGTDVIEAFFHGLLAAPGQIASFAASLAEALRNEMGDFIVWIIDALNEAIPNEIDVNNGPNINIPDNPIPGGSHARGGILTDPRFILAGEDGPEAIIPLDRNLARVDPAVRALSAIAQGLAVPGGGKTIDVGGISIITPTEDPVAVAQETINQLAATGYF